MRERRYPATLRCQECGQDFLVFDRPGMNRKVCGGACLRAVRSRGGQASGRRRNTVKVEVSLDDAGALLLGRYGPEKSKKHPAAEQDASILSSVPKSKR